MLAKISKITKFFFTSPAKGSDEESQTQKRSSSNFYSNYSIGSRLGDGISATVYEATELSSGSKFAAKVFDRENVNASHEVVIESEILSSLDHPHIIKLIEHFDKELIMVLEYMRGGELFDRIVKKTYYSEKEARDIMKRIVSAIKCCHDHDIIHQ